MDATRPLSELHEWGGRIEILDLLRSRQFDALERLLASYQERFEEDVAEELRVRWAFGAFGMRDPSIKPLLEEWVQRDAYSYVAQLARAEYFSGMGFQARGTKWARETAPEQLSKMKELFLEAGASANLALGLRPKLTEAYRILIGIAMAGDLGNAASDLTARGLAAVPTSFLVRRAFVQQLLPRWGGSYEALRRFAGQSQSVAQSNPSVRALLGFVAWDQARGLRSDKRYAEAAVLFTDAMKHGAHWEFVSERGDTYYRQGRYAEALEDLEEANALWPQEPEVLLDLARTLQALDRENDFTRVLALVEKLHPGDASASRLRVRAEAHRAKTLVHDAYQIAESGRFSEAVELLDQALRLSPMNAEALYWRGRNRLKMGEQDMALQDLLDAVRSNPGYFEAYQNIDRILAQRKDWDRIIAHWDDFLRIESQHAGAYLERAGAYRHKGDMAHALADLKTACELGNVQACQIQARR